ncbi:hypothetical protein [Candidatus Ruminimicrobium bovinum]|uniref:hypothetical protein n=1 Tax=Candidatus Ruminimicrobium bovinum TaxID=3242779 RepID=UPI0039B91E93
MLFPIDKDTLSIIKESKEIFKEHVKIIGLLLKKVSNVRNEKLSTIAINTLLVTQESIALEIIENMLNGGIIISIIALRTLFENFVNIHYIFHHPEHIKDKKWAEDLCNDFINRSYSNDYNKSKSLSDRAKEVYFKEFYDVIYTDLCTYSHSLMKTIDIGDKNLLRLLREETSIYTIMFLQDSISAVLDFFNPTNIDYDIMPVINRIKTLKERIKK